jgi:hypothetical protein
MKKVDLINFDKFHKQDNVYYVIIAQDTHYEERYIGKLKREIDDFDMDVYVDLNNPINKWKTIIVKDIDDVFLLNEFEKRVLLI